MMLGAIPLVILGAGGRSLLANPGFDDGLSGWRADAPNARVEAVSVDGRSAARITVAGDAEVGFPRLYQEVPAQPGDLLLASVDAMKRGVRDGHGVYAAIEFYGPGPERVSHTDSSAVHFEGQWTTLRLRAFVPPGCTRAQFLLLLNGRGEGYFDDATLVRTPGTEHEPLDAPVTLTVTDRIVCPSLIGFGAEDDGWFYAPENLDRGITDQDIALREDRIRWMDPDWVRMFFWYKDWCPSGDWETFDFDTPNMASHYRTLDLYQRIGARVNVTGVEWGVPDPYGHPDRAARAIGALFEHLIRTRGYTCVQDWTLSNEPNGAFVQMGYDFERFVEIHRLVRAEFARRGLAVNIVGSDDTGGLEWYTRCVKDDGYFAAADLFSSHRYLKHTDRFIAPYFFDDRLSLLEACKPGKPFVVGEFGFQDERSGTFENPIMETYPYAVWTAAFAIEGLNRGVAGFSIWCLHEVYYPGGDLMNYGLWDFPGRGPGRPTARAGKDNGWKPRPVYHAWAMFTRLTEAGDQVRQCRSSHPGHVMGALVGDTLFWVNRGDEPAEVRLSGFQAREVRVMTESTLEGDRECGTLETVEGNRFTAPPQSFGFAR